MEARGCNFCCDVLGLELVFGVLPVCQRESNMEIDTNAPRRVGVEIEGKGERYWNRGHLLLCEREHILLIIIMFLQ